MSRTSCPLASDSACDSCTLNQVSSIDRSTLSMVSSWDCKLSRTVRSIAERMPYPTAANTTIATIGQIQSCLLRISRVREIERPSDDCPKVT